MLLSFSYYFLYFFLNSNIIKKSLDVKKEFVILQHLLTQD